MFDCGIFFQLLFYGLWHSQQLSVSHFTSHKSQMLANVWDLATSGSRAFGFDLAVKRKEKLNLYLPMCNVSIIVTFLFDKVKMFGWESECNCPEATDFIFKNTN